MESHGKTPPGSSRKATHAQSEGLSTPGAPIWSRESHPPRPAVVRTCFQPNRRFPLPHRTHARNLLALALALAGCAGEGELDAPKEGAAQEPLLSTQ